MNRIKRLARAGGCSRSAREARPRALVLFTLSALVAVLSQPSLARVQETELLRRERIDALPAAERVRWLRYLEVSAQQTARDRSVLHAELRNQGRTLATPAPAGEVFTVQDAHTPEWFRTLHAQRSIDVILSFQTPAGGWSKRIDYGSGVRQPGMSWTSTTGWSYVGTFDNSATTEQLRFLASAFRAAHDDRIRQAYLRGIEYVLRAQFPNGCWPQVFPLQGGYHDAATFNDDAMVHVLDVLREAAHDSSDLVPDAMRPRLAAALARGVDCIVRTQVIINGRRTVWGAQHDPLSLQPVAARAYEPASLSGAESAGVMRFLMRIDSPAPTVIEAVHAAAAWFRTTAIRDFVYEMKGGLTPRPGAVPIWARFYEIGTNRPIFSNRDGIIRYDFHQLEEERRLGYAWYSDRPADALRAYERWARRHPLPAMR